MAVTASSDGLRWPLRLLTLALFAALAFLLVRIVMSLTNPESLWRNDGLNTSSPIAVSQTAQNFSFKSDPFNRTRKDVSVVQEVLNQDVPETTLNLRMTGRIAGEQGSAILRTSDNKEAVYKIDDEVISDVFLKAVNKDFVVLSVNGQLQRLTFERDEDVGLKTPVTKTASKVSALTPNIAMTQNVVSLLQNVNLRRSMKNGRLEGYKVKSNRPDVDLSKFGLKKGDIVTQVDNKDITQGRIDFLKLFQEAAQKGQVEVTVLRNGQSQKIQLGSN